MPSLGIAPRSERCTDPSTMSAQSMAPVSGIFPADGSLHRLDIGISGNPAFAISRGSRGASSLTPEPDRRFPGMLLSPSPFGSGSAIGPRNLPSSFSQLNWEYDGAPGGALEVEEVDERRRAHQPRVAAPGGQVVPPLGASHPRLLLGRNGLSSQQSPVGQLDAESVPAACTFRSCSSACEGCHRRRCVHAPDACTWASPDRPHACRSLAVRTTPARGTTKTTTSSSSPSVARIGNAALLSLIHI